MTASTPRARKSDSVSGVLERLAAHDPQRAVLVWDNRRISIGALLEESRRVAGGLAELGIVAGDRVALWLPNTPAWLALYLACARLGAIAVAVNTRFRSSEIADILGRSGARLLVLWPDFRHMDFLTILTEATQARCQFMRMKDAHERVEFAQAKKQKGMCCGRPSQGLSEHSIHAPLTHPQLPCDHLSGHASLCHRPDLIGLVPRCWRSPLELALSLGLGNPFALPLQHHLALELS